MTAHENEHRAVLYSGRVQGVGFRYTTRSIARRFAVDGYVKNLSDGRVELAVEGLPRELDDFLREVREHFTGHIRDESCDRRSAVGEYRGFEIAY